MRSAYGDGAIGVAARPAGTKPWLCAGHPRNSDWIAYGAIAGCAVAGAAYGSNRAGIVGYPVGAAIGLFVGLYVTTAVDSLLVRPRCKGWAGWP